MKTTPTASRVFGATTLLGPALPGGNGGLEPSDIHRLWTLAGNRVRCTAVRRIGGRQAFVHARSAASIVGGRIVAIVMCCVVMLPIKGVLYRTSSNGCREYGIRYVITLVRLQVLSLGDCCF